MGEIQLESAVLLGQLIVIHSDGKSRTIRPFRDSETTMSFYSITGVLCATLLFTGTVNCTVANAQSATVCDSYARNYAKNASRQGQVIGKGAVGSLIGAGIGAAFGGAAIGAAVGGGLGLIGGSSSRQKTANRMYNAAFQDCMAGRVR